VNFLNKSLQAISTEEKRSNLQQCRECLEHIEPYAPAGVDPRMAEAVQGVKSAMIAEVDFRTSELGAWFPDDSKLNVLHQQTVTAEALLKSEIRNFLEKVSTQPLLF